MCWLGSLFGIGRLVGVAGDRDELCQVVVLDSVQGHFDSVDGAVNDLSDLELGAKLKEVLLLVGVERERAEVVGPGVPADDEQGACVVQHLLDRVRVRRARQEMLAGQQRPVLELGGVRQLLLNAAVEGKLLHVGELSQRGEEGHQVPTALDDGEGVALLKHVVEALSDGVVFAFVLAVLGAKEAL